MYDYDLSSLNILLRPFEYLNLYLQIYKLVKYNTHLI